MKKIPDLQQPLNSDERLLYGIALRLDAIIDILNTLVQTKADEQEVAIENHTHQEIIMDDVKPKRKRK